ncbi:hypothetical protein LINPERHAP2_LOCUS25484 [Linum perenne]
MSISTITKSNSEIQKDRDCGNLVKIFPPFKSQQQQKESIFCYITHHQHGPPPRSQSYSIDEHTAKPAVYLTVNSGFLLQSRSHPSLHPGMLPITQSAVIYLLSCMSKVIFVKYWCFWFIT